VVFTAAALIGILIVGLIVALCIFLIVPYIIGATANAVGGRVTNRPLNLGCLGYIFVAVVGAFVGHWLMGNYGPRIFDIYVIPAFIGSIIVSIILSLLVNRRGGGRY
jgi:uncharacterized membrane protein YeaQ/YmgE (transglycosylase-associated protein family)